MNARPPRWGDQAARLLALLALVLRLAIAGLPVPAGAVGHAAALAAASDEFPICHGEAGEASSEPDPSGMPHAPGHDCALCPMCHVAAAAALLPAAVLVVPPRSAGDASAGSPPPSTGPPRHDRYAARPRGPPAPPV